MSKYQHCKFGQEDLPLLPNGYQYNPTQYSIDVLDHGFVVLHNIAGPVRRQLDDVTAENYGDGPSLRHFDADDRDPAQAARMSFGQFGSERTYEQDMKLADYLIRNDHNTPLEMIEVWVEMKLPIFVDRQFVRHRTWTRNENSARYIQLPEEWYIPHLVGAKPQGGAKQGQTGFVPVALGEQFRADLNKQCQDGYDKYRSYIEQGVAPEEARMFLHVNHYVQWLGKVNLSNLFRFLRLRTHSHAQRQARAYACAVLDLMKPHLPGLMELYEKHIQIDE